MYLYIFIKSPYLNILMHYKHTLFRIISMGMKGNLADAGNLADSNISETINGTKKNCIYNL